IEAGGGLAGLEASEQAATPDTIAKRTRPVAVAHTRVKDFGMKARNARKRKPVPALSVLRSCLWLRLPRLLGYSATRLLGYWATRPLGYSATRRPGRMAELPSCRAAELPSCRAAELPSCRPVRKNRMSLRVTDACNNPRTHMRRPIHAQMLRARPRWPRLL